MVTTLAPPPHIRDVARGPALDEALAKVGSWLAREGLTDVFNVQLRHGHFEVGPDEALLERTDEAARVQETRVVPRESVNDSEAATYGFTPAGTPVATGWCIHIRGPHI